MSDENTSPDDSNKCIQCDKEKVDSNRSVSKMCRLCRQKEQRLNLKRKPLVSFNFERGCHDALATNNSEQDMDHYALGARFLKTKPVKFSFEKKRKANSSVVITGLFNTQNINMLRDAGISLADNSTYYDSYSCGIKLFEETGLENYSTQSNNTIRDILKKSYPKIDTLLGPFMEMDASVTNIISQDFRLNPKLLPEVADLFSGAIISHKGDALLLITTEIYSRASSLDTHTENEYHASSLPIENKTRYPGVYFGTVMSADGKKLKSKLEIGTETMNLLCTNSITLDKSQTVFIGPETGLIFETKETSVYLIKSKVDKLKEVGNIFEAPFPSIDSLRQLTSGFHSPTTYTPFRKTLTSFNDPLHKPATIFNLCDLPNNGGYGSNDGAYSRCASRFFQMLAIAVINSSGSLDRASFDSFKSTYNLQKSDANNWKTLEDAMNNMGDFFGENDQINIYKFAMMHNLSDVTDGVSSGLSVSNSKIKENIQARFRTLYY